MIYTVTLNPAIDLFVDTPTMNAGEVNRTNSADIQANGKGINVSFILHRLGVGTTAIGIGGGFTLDHITQALTDNAIPNYFVRTTGTTRINVFTRVRQTNQEYKLVNPGPTVQPTELAQLFDYLEILKPDDILCISGSFSKGISPDSLKRFAQIVQAHHAQLVVDTSYTSVLDILPFHPLLIKPNEAELKSWFNVKESLSRPALAQLGKRLITAGAQNVLISLGSNGAILVTPRGILSGNSPKVKVVNTAGAGDTMLGTFLAGLTDKMSNTDNLARAIVAGSDTARSTWITDFKHTADLSTQVHVTKEEL